jgi:hypothetical protein
VIVPAHQEHRRVQQHAGGDRGDAERERPEPAPVRERATALVHGLTLATRTPAAFKAARVKCFDPWGWRPDAAEEDADWRQAARTGPLWLKNLFVRA